MMLNLFRRKKQIESKYYGIKSSCCTDDNIASLNVEKGLYACKTCMRVMLLNEVSK